jgi:hypothetical protein
MRSGGREIAMNERDIQNLIDQLAQWKSDIIDEADIYEDSEDEGDSFQPGGTCTATRRVMRIRNETVTLDRSRDGILPELVEFKVEGVPFKAALQQATSHEAIYFVEEVC